MSGRDFSTTQRSRPAAWETGLVAAGVLAAILAASSAANARAGLRAARADLEQVRRETQADRARIQSLQSGRGSGDRFAAQALLTAEAEPPRVVADVAALLPEDVRLESLSLSYGEKVELDLQVAAKRANAYDLFLERLSQSPRIRDVQPGAESRDGEVRATVRASYLPGAR